MVCRVVRHRTRVGFPKVGGQTMNASNTSSPSSATEPVLDEAVLDELFDAVAGGMPDVVQELIDTFVEDGRGHLERLEQALESGDARLAVLSVHSLKSSGGTFGAYKLASLAAEWEAQARRGELNQVRDRLAALRAAFEEVTALLLARRPS